MVKGWPVTIQHNPEMSYSCWRFCCCFSLLLLASLLLIRFDVACFPPAAVMPTASVVQTYSKIKHIKVYCGTSIIGNNNFSRSRTRTSTLEKLSDDQISDIRQNFQYIDSYIKNQLPTSVISARETLRLNCIHTWSRLPQVELQF